MVLILPKTLLFFFILFQRGKPKLITFHEKLKPYVEFTELLKNASVGFFKLSCFGLGAVLLWNDLSGPRHVPRITRVLVSF